MIGRRLTLAAWFALSTLSLHAQLMESLAGVRLHFDDPGARAAAMGGANVALTNEWATNPASLAGAKQIAIVEASHRAQTTRYVTGIGASQLITTDVAHSSNGVSAITFVTPLSGITTSLTYDEPIDEQRSADPAASTSNGFITVTRQGKITFNCATCFGGGVRLPNFPLVDVSLRLQRWNGSLAWQHGPLSLGASVRYTQAREETASDRLPYDLERIDDASWSYVAGLKWDITPALHAGASYESPAAVNGTQNTGTASITTPKRFETPATWRGGVAIDAASNLTLAADAVRIRYSRLTRGRFNDVVPFDGMNYPDVMELHAGAEYRIGSVAVRGGWWRDPAHGLEPIGRWDSTNAQLSLLENRSENHVTAGFSAGTRTRLDAAIDRGSRSTRVIVGVGATY